MTLLYELRKCIENFTMYEMYEPYRPHTDAQIDRDT